MIPGDWNPISFGFFDRFTRSSSERYFAVKGWRVFLSTCSLTSCSSSLRRFLCYGTSYFWDCGMIWGVGWLGW